MQSSAASPSQHMAMYEPGVTGLGEGASRMFFFCTEAVMGMRRVLLMREMIQVWQFPLSRFLRHMLGKKNYFSDIM